VPVEKTRVFGCSTKWSDKREDARKSLEKWDQEPVRLEQLDASGVAKLARNDSEKLLLINVWASFCGPCIAELPELVTMNRMYRRRNFEMITLSIDEPEQKDAALRVLEEAHASSKNYIVHTKSRDELAELLDKQWPGPIPYTLLIAPGGRVIYRAVNEIDPLEVRRAIADHLGRTYASRPAK
jgi:thiol-disulfide isomerase/thioredoxin